jgi:preprotein translocase subunit Sec61beta
VPDPNKKKGKLSPAQVVVVVGIILLINLVLLARLFGIMFSP